MVLAPVVCPACQQPVAVYRHGTATEGTQHYRGTACCRTFQLRYRHQVREAGVGAKITDLALHGSGIRDTARVLGISPQTVMGELKKRWKP